MRDIRPLGETPDRDPWRPWGSGRVRTFLARVQPAVAWMLFGIVVLGLSFPSLDQLWALVFSVWALVNGLRMLLDPWPIARGNALGPAMTRVSGATLLILGTGIVVVAVLASIP